MAKVLGPNNIPITAAAQPQATRASGENFGAQVGAAQQKFGDALESIGKAAGVLKERRQGAEDQAFLDRADLELDLTYGKIGQEEQERAKAGAVGVFDTVRSRLENETDPVYERLREQGFNPSEDALNKAKSIAIRRQHQYLKSAVAYENNERIRHLGSQLDNTLATIANRGALSGDLDNALERAEQSIKSHEGILPPGELAQMRERAAKHFYDQVRANGDPESLERLLQSQAQPAQGAEAAPAKNDAIGRASAAAGVPEAVLRTFAKIESGGDPEARTGSYKGLFQLSDAEFKKHGGGNIYSADDNAMAAARKLKNEAAEFQSKYGRPPTATDLYLVHQQGEAGYAAHMANPEAPAWQNMASTGEGRQKGAGWAKLAIWGNIPDDMKKRFPGGVDSVTSADFIKIWDEKVQRIGGGSAVMQDDTIRGAFSRVLTEKAPEIIEVMDRRREKRALAERAQQILTGAMPVDPNSKDDRKTIDKAFEATDLTQRLAEGDPGSAAALTQLAQKTGYIPDAASSQLRAMSINGTPETKVFAYETAANLMREKPGILEGSDHSKRLKDDATLYETYTVDMGLPAEQALSRIEELRTPEFEKRREALKKDTTDFMKEVTGDELAAEFDGWFSSAPELGGSPRQAGVVVDSYRELVRDHYLRTGDKEVARAMAKKDLLRTYAISDATDKRRLMRFPPENFYPKIEPRAGKEPDHSYFTRQLVETVKEAAGKDIPIQDIYIEPVAQTNADVRAGRMPGYGVVWFEDRDGVRVMQSAPMVGGREQVFRADVKTELERQKTNREQRLREERKREIDRQSAIENDPARRGAKAIIRGITDAYTKPEVLSDEAPNLVVAP